MIVPHMKRLTDFLHSRGKHCPWPEPDAPEDVRAAAVEAFVQSFCVPEKPCLLNDMHQPNLTPELWGMLRQASMKQFSKAK